MTSPIDAWKAIAKFHEEQLAIAKTKVQEMEAPVEVLLTEAEMKKRVIALETRTAMKFSWKKAVENGLVSNVQHILNECYDSYRDREEMGAEFVAKAKERMGKRGSLKWQLFALDVITQLKKNHSFCNEDTKDFDDFEDTAGGCDEVTWNVGIDIIEETVMPAAPAPVAAAPAPVVAPTYDDAAVAAAERAQYGRA